MRNKRGFTLIELLAVIVILAIIALIAVPIILNMIQNARKAAAIDTAYGYVDSVEYAMGLSDAGMTGYEDIDIKNQEYDIEDEDLENIKIKGKRPDSGTITIEKRRVTYADLCIYEFEVEYKNNEAKIVKSNKCKAGSGGSGGGSSEPSEPKVPDAEPCELAEETVDNKKIYYIDSEEDMYAFAASVNSGHNYSGEKVVLRNSLDFSDYTPEKKTKVCSNGDNTEGFTPIAGFAGTFEGSAKTIKNLTINRPNEDYVGLFKSLSGATVKGIIFDNITVVGNNRVAILVGNASQSTIKEIMFKDVNLTATSTGDLLTGDLQGGSRDNILVKDATVKVGNTTYLRDIGHVIIENSTITATSYDTYQNNYISANVKVNGTNITNGFPASDIDDINFYESIGMDTWIGGDNDGSGYYFDYNNSGKIVLKSVELNPIPTSANSTFDKEGDYYLIKNESDWKKLSVFGKSNLKIKLKSDLNFANKKFYMLGSAYNYCTSATCNVYTGTFDGGAHTISGITINATKGYNIGLFGYTSNATIVGLTVKNVKVKANGASSIVAGYTNGGTIKEIVLDNNELTVATPSNSHAGPLVGDLQGGSRVNILVKNSKINVNNLSYFRNTDRSLVENSELTGTNVSVSADYYSNAVKVNGTKVTTGYSESDIGDINFYEAMGLDTWIGGDNDGSGYYFDYENSSSNNIVLKSVETSPIPTNANDTFDKSGDYYLIKNESDWKKLSAFSKSNLKAKLTNDINFTNKHYYMLGSAFSYCDYYANSCNSYNGTFDGGAHTVKGIVINASKVGNVGLFGYVSGANIVGLNIENVKIKSGGKAGVISGDSNAGSIKELCLNNIELTVKGQSAGPVVSDLHGGSRSNILVKNVKMNGEYISYLRDINNVIVENSDITGTNVSISTTYYSNAVKVNNENQSSGFASNKINDLTYYSGKIETVLNGDNNNTGYYFDNDLDKGGIYLVEKTQQLGWKLLTSKTPKENQKWSYYQSANTRITDGWGRSITDLSGQLQDYYFENGIAIKGWKQIEGSWYYFSETDADKNGYIDFNKVYGGDITIGNRTCTFNSSGVCTSCSSGSCGS